MTNRHSHRDSIAAKLAKLRANLNAVLATQNGRAVVQAPPGSGKTHLLAEAAHHAWREGQRVAVATQTTAQSDEICERIATLFPAIRVVRFASKSDRTPPSPMPQIRRLTDATDLPSGPCIVVATASKWAYLPHDGRVQPFDVLIVDEAWQLPTAEFALIAGTAPCRLLIGDPGQIEPTITIDVSRWVTATVGPHRPAPELLLADSSAPPMRLSLPATRRLPADSARLIQPFYDFDFTAWAAPGDRFLSLASRAKNSRQHRPIDHMLDHLCGHSYAGFTLPTPPSGPPVDTDPDLANLAATVISRLLSRQTQWHMDGQPGPLCPQDIGLCATHRTMVTDLQLALPSNLRNAIRVETAERWQGLQRKVMIAVHPLSHTDSPTAFDLTTGRLCVMASRHQVALILLTRDHLATTLAAHLPAADHPLGTPDTAGLGHHRHQNFLAHVPMFAAK